MENGKRLGGPAVRQPRKIRLYNGNNGWQCAIIPLLFPLSASLYEQPFGHSGTGLVKAGRPCHHYDGRHQRRRSWDPRAIFPGGWASVPHFGRCHRLRYIPGFGSDRPAGGGPRRGSPLPPRSASGKRGSRQDFLAAGLLPGRYGKPVSRLAR